MNSKRRRGVAEGGDKKRQQEERKEKNKNCRARQTPKKLLTNERIIGEGGEGVGVEEAKQSKEKEQSGWDGRAIVSWKRWSLCYMKRKEKSRWGGERGTHYLMTGRSREGEGGEATANGWFSSCCCQVISCPPIRTPCALWKHWVCCQACAAVVSVNSSLRKKESEQRQRQRVIAVHSFAGGSADISCFFFLACGLCFIFFSFFFSSSCSFCGFVSSAGRCLVTKLVPLFCYSPLADWTSPLTAPATVSATPAGAGVTNVADVDIVDVDVVDVDVVDGHPASVLHMRQHQALHQTRPRLLSSSSTASSTATAGAGATAAAAATKPPSAAMAASFDMLNGGNVGGSAAYMSNVLQVATPAPAALPASPLQSTAGARFGAIDNLDDVSASAVQELSQRLQEMLRDAKSRHLACTEVTLPNDLTQRIAAEIIRMSEREPCGERACTIFILFESEPNNVR